jgi:hypothetical protein
MMQKVEKVLLSDGHKYSGYGILKGNDFIPNGYGIKYYSDMYAKGNFIDGELNGPAIISHDYFMTTVQMKENRGNGWGLCINRGMLVDFGYYSNSKLKVNLLETVEWYFEKMLAAGREEENMLYCYTSKSDGRLTELHVGYTAKDLENGVSLCNMGFHFLDDGSVWVGSSASRKMTGILMKFCSNGFIQVGRFENGEFLEEKNIQDVIDNYYGIFKFNDDNDFAFLCSKKTNHEEKQKRIRKQFNNIIIDASRNYFE